MGHVIPPVGARLGSTLINKSGWAPRPRPAGDPDSGTRTLTFWGPATERFTHAARGYLPNPDRVRDGLRNQDKTKLCSRFYKLRKISTYVSFSLYIAINIKQIPLCLFYKRKSMRTHGTYPGFLRHMDLLKAMNRFSL